MKRIDFLALFWSFAVAGNAQAGASLADTLHGEGSRIFGRVFDYKDGLLVVGDKWADHDGKERAGLVHVYEPVVDPATGEKSWQKTATISASDGDAYDYFGTGVATDNGSMIVVGASGHDSKGYDAGAAYLFVRNEDGTWSESWKFEPVIHMHNAPEMDNFGYAVDVTNNAIVIGAPLAASIYNEAPAAGGYYLYIREGDGWQRELHIGGHDEGEKLGYSVSLTNHFGESYLYEKERYIVAAGGYGADGEAGTISLSTFGEVFGVPPRWVTNQYDGGSLVSPGARFGYSVSVRSDLLAVGAPYHTENFEAEGKAIVYRVTRNLPHVAHVTLAPEGEYLATDEQGNYVGAYHHAFGSAIKLDASSDDHFTGVWSITVGAPTTGGGIADNAVYRIRQGRDSTTTPTRIMSQGEAFGRDVDFEYYDGIFVGDQTAVHPLDGVTGAVYYYLEDD